MNTHKVCATFVATVGAALALASTSTLAGKPGSGGGGNYNPEIAYTANQGATYSVYLANADGSNAVAVFSQKNRGVGKVDFVPGSGPTGGQLVFGNTIGSLSVLTYTATTNGIKTTNVRVLVPEGPSVYFQDVSRDGTFVLYGVSNGDNTSTVKVVRLDGSTPPVTVVAGARIPSAVWSHDLTRIAVLDGFQSVANLQQIKMLTLDANFQPTGAEEVIYDPSCSGCLGSDVEFARTRNSVLFSESTSTAIDMYEVDASAPPSAVTPYGSGSSPCSNWDDSKILYRNFSDSRLYVLDVSTGSRRQVTSIGVHQFDFRPAPPTP